jgi:NMT1-like family
MLLLAAAFAAILAPASPSARAAEAGPKGSVTIFTDGMAAPNGRITRALTELSTVLDKSGKVRMLPIMAQGGEANVRDLLRFRGADLAVVNSDVFAAASVQKAYPEAPRKLRAITRLHSQKIFLLARPEIASVDQLAGKKIAILGPQSTSKLTAAAFFGLLKLKTELVDIEEGVDLRPPADAQAVFVLEDEARRLLPAVVPSAEFRLLPVASTPDIAKFYSAAVIDPAESGEFGSGASVPTIAVDTILATFDWLPAQPRFADVTTFIDRLFAALPELRRAYPSSIWDEASPLADVPGWRRYDYAETARRALMAKAAPAGVPAAAVPVAKSASVAALPASAPFRLSIVSYPPLTDQHAPGGGLIGELTVAAMERADPPYNRNLAFVWQKDRVAQAKAVFSDKVAEMGVPWERTSCKDAGLLWIPGVASCDGALASEPLFKVLLLFFVGTSSDFAFTGDESLTGRSICLPADRDLSGLGDAGKKLADDGKMKLVRPASLIECLDAVQRGEADAVLSNELEGRLTISRLGLSDAFRMSDRAVGTQDIEIILAKETPEADRVLAALNKGIAKLKGEDLYSRIVAKHLAQINAGN